MRVGTRSVLFGAHCILIHWIFIAIAWIKLYGFPFDIRIWIAFFIHDIGYFRKPNLDGPEGLLHVELAGSIMQFVFGKYWGDFCRNHSRHYCKKFNQIPSKLCYADKLVPVLEPKIFYLWRINLSGEIHEYKKFMNSAHLTDEEWLNMTRKNLKNIAYNENPAGAPYTFGDDNGKG